MNVLPKDKDLRGWLRRKTGLIKIWARRWFVLTDRFLFIFLHDDDKKSQDCIFLCGQILVEPPLDPNDPRSVYFDIVTEDDKNPSETLSLCAETEEEKKFWVRALKRALYAEKGGALFSQSLEEILYWEHRAGRYIPYIVDECVEYLYKYGLDVEGIFRLPGRQTVVKDTLTRFERGQKVRFEDESTDVHVVASVLKTFLRSLPDSIIPCCFFQKFMGIGLKYSAGKDETSLEPLVLELKEALKLIPKDNYTILKYICRFLREVGNHESTNKMSLMSIGTVFSYNILRHIDTENNQLFLLTADLGQNLVYMLLKYYSQFPQQTPEIQKLDNTIKVFSYEYNYIRNKGNNTKSLLRMSCRIDIPVLVPEMLDTSLGPNHHKGFNLIDESDMNDNTTSEQIRITDDCLLFSEHCGSVYKNDDDTDNIDVSISMSGSANEKKGSLHLNLTELGETKSVTEYIDISDVTEKVSVCDIIESVAVASVTEQVTASTEHVEVTSVTEHAASVCSYSSSSLTEDFNSDSLCSRQTKSKLSRNRFVNARRRPLSINLHSGEWSPQAIHSPGGINSEDVLNALALLNTPMLLTPDDSCANSTPEKVLEVHHFAKSDLNTDYNIEDLKDQVTALKEELSQHKVTSRAQIATLKAQLTSLKEKYEYRIETVQNEYKSRIKELENKLSIEKNMCASIIADKIQLQETFNRYQMLYGDLS